MRRRRTLSQRFVVTRPRRMARRMTSAGTLVAIVGVAGPLLLFGIGPVLWLVAQALGRVDLGQLAGPDTRHALGNTVITSAGAAGLALALALPLGLLLYRTDLPFRAPLTAAFTL